PIGVAVSGLNSNKALMPGRSSFTLMCGMLVQFRFLNNVIIVNLFMFGEGGKDQSCKKDEGKNENGVSITSQQSNKCADEENNSCRKQPSYIKTKSCSGCAYHNWKQLWYINRQCSLADAEEKRHQCHFCKRNLRY